jgi:hypothetical protein
MMFNLSHKACTSVPTNALRRWTRATILCVCSLFCAGFSMGQGTVPVNVNDFFSAVNYTGMSGDTMTFSFSLGTIEAPVSGAAGFQLDFTFPKLLSLATSVLVEVGGSWLTDGLPDQSATCTYDATSSSLSIDYVRSDEEGQSGHGKILSIALVRQGGFSRYEAAMYLEGGVVLVENIHPSAVQDQTPPSRDPQTPKR